MRAAVYYGPEDIRIQDVPTPKPGPGEILLRVHACAICGTDVRIYFHGQKNVVPPAITGHEICGTIEALGDGVHGYKVGQRAVVVTPVGCGRCRFCRGGVHNLCVDFRAVGYQFPGGFAEYMPLNEAAVRQGNVIIAPDSLPPDEGALVEPLSCCINGQEYLDVSIGDTVAVIGAGPIGGMHVELARSQGATKVILVDIAEHRLAMARERFSADVLVDSSKEDPVARVMAETDGAGADVVIVACGVASAQQQAIRMAAFKGRVSLFAGLPKDKPTVELDSNAIHYRELSVYGAFASHSTDYMRALSLVASRRVDARKFITARLPLESIVEGMKMSKSGEGLKVVVNP
jgi:L-iditol 2-dehydrogenase